MISELIENTLQDKYGSSVSVRAVRSPNQDAQIIRIWPNYEMMPYVAFEVVMSGLEEAQQQSSEGLLALITSRVEVALKMAKKVYWRTGNSGLEEIDLQCR